MDNEFNNNQSDDIINNNNEPPFINNMEPSVDQSQQQTIDYINNTGEFYTYDNTNRMNDASSQPIMQNPNSDVKTKKSKIKKSKAKKSRVLRALQFTAVAVAFGLVAAVSFQGYLYVMYGSVNGSNNIGKNVAEVKESLGNKDTIIPSQTSTSGEVVTDVSDVVENVMPSIVAITSSANQTTQDFFGREFSQPVQGSGSGIIIGQNDSQLLIVTNNHVINGATSVQIKFANGKTASATIKGADANADLAILSVNTKELPAETLKAIKVAVLGKSDQIKAGDMAIAIGNALGYGQSVTVGYISAVNREVTIDNKTMKLLQTDAAINPGNSGGALLNSNGEVIGINSVKYASEDVEGMGYAIPISTALPMMNELMNRQVISADEKGYLGLNTKAAQNVTEEYSKRFNLPIGIYVNEVENDSPVAKAGLQQGDIITGVDKVEVKTVDDLANALSYKKAGQTIDLRVQVKSNGKYVEKVLKVTLGKGN